MIFPNPFRFVVEMFRVLKGLLNREPLFVTQEVEDERWATCRPCEHYDPDGQQCRACTCFLQIKIPLSETRCPKKKWRR